MRKFKNYEENKNPRSPRCTPGNKKLMKNLTKLTKYAQECDKLDGNSAIGSQLTMFQEKSKFFGENDREKVTQSHQKSLAWPAKEENWKFNVQRSSFAEKVFGLDQIRTSKYKGFPKMHKGKKILTHFFFEQFFSQNRMTGFDC